MAKTSFDPNFDSDLNFDFAVFDGYDDDNEELKFDLYLMTREIKQASSSLSRVALLPKKQRERWLRENQAQLQQLMDGLVHDVVSVFEDMEVDKIVLADSIACVTELRELINTLNSLSGENKPLRG